MTATVNEIAAGLRTNLATVSGLRVFDHVPDVFAPPCGFVMFDSVEFNNAYASGNPRYSFTVTLVVGRTSDRAAQESLNGYLDMTGNGSVYVALNSDSTLGGKAQDLVVIRADNMRMIQSGEVTHLAVDFDVLVHA
jgi:hypothetical protein